MNLAKLIRHTCANFNRSKCLGVKFHVNGTSQYIESDKTGKQCWAAIQRCKYFEKTVLPGLNKDNSEKKLLENGLSAYSTAGWLGLSDNQILDKINQLRDEGFNAFKLKVGQDIDFDISRIQYIRENVDPDTLLNSDFYYFFGIG